MVVEWSHQKELVRHWQIWWRIFNDARRDSQKSSLGRSFYENHLKATLKMTYELTSSHLNPVGYQKMDVPMAYYVYSDAVGNAMKILHDKPMLLDCDPSISLIFRMKDIIEVMSSRTPGTALRHSSKDCKSRKIGG
ncbi:hypothetical protein QAD02_007201 [Eretmocerus hayati]|uniref:Uncharacterized protein n=1 Tax=Eretmocerus hayati TaxID=131215 RepID=A0ACC2N5C9_9HYME|nr:hypothetical protein QAD02_007201 [Eretmocerus hayati]